jgi:hypothetical protein
MQLFRDQVPEHLDINLALTMTKGLQRWISQKLHPNLGCLYDYCSLIVSVAIPYESQAINIHLLALTSYIICELIVSLNVVETRPVTESVLKKVSAQSDRVHSKSPTSGFCMSMPIFSHGFPGI